MDLQQQVAEIDRNVTTILHLLTGTSLDKNQGLIFEFAEERIKAEKLEKRVTKLEKWKDRAIWIAIGAALPTGYGIASIFSMLFKMIK